MLSIDNNSPKKMDEESNSPGNSPQVALESDGEISTSEGKKAMPMFSRINYKT